MKLKIDDQTSVMDYLAFATAAARQMNRKRSIRYKYHCCEHFVLTYGKAFNPLPLPNGSKHGKQKQCYTNAYHMARRLGLSYAEGYAHSVIPVLHAWVVDENGNAYDPTWEKLGKEYVGVVFPIHYVEKIMLARGYYGIIDSWEIGHPLLTGDHEYPITEETMEKEVKRLV